MQISSVRPYPQPAHIMVIAASVGHKHSRPLPSSYVKCSGIYIIASRIAHTAKAITVRSRTGYDIAADRVVNNLVVLIPAPPPVIVYQHHIARYKVAWVAERRLDYTQRRQQYCRK